MNMETPSGGVAGPAGLIPTRPFVSPAVPTASPSPVAATATTVPAAAPALPKVDPQVLREQLQQAVEELNEQMRRNGRELNFSMDGQLDRWVISVHHRETGELIRQIPDETVLHLAHHIEDMRGLLFSDMG